MEHAFLNIALLFQFVYAAMALQTWMRMMSAMDDRHAKDNEVILQTKMYLQARMCTDKMIQHPDS